MVTPVLTRSSVAVVGCGVVGGGVVNVVRHGVVGGMGGAIGGGGVTTVVGVKGDGWYSLRRAGYSNLDYYYYLHTAAT